MRAQWSRVVIFGSVVALAPVVALAQGAQPVQVVPVTPAGPAVIVPVTPAGRAAAPATPAPQGPAAPAAQVQTPPPSSYYPVVPVSSRKLELAFANGRVTLAADNVTVGEILAEWAKKGGTVIDNADKLGGGPVSFVFQDRPELEVMQALLRPYAGCIIAPRLPSRTIASAFSRINIVARSTATSSTFVGAPPPPAYSQPMPDDEIPPVARPGFVPPASIPQGPPSPPQGPLTQPSAGPSSPTPGVQVAPVQPGQVIKPPTVTGPGRGGGPGGGA